MRCPWGCRPERWLSAEETRQVYARLSRITERYNQELAEAAP